MDKGKLVEKIERVEKMVIDWGEKRKEVEEKIEGLKKRITELKKGGGKIEEIIKKEVEKGKEKGIVEKIEEGIREKRMKRLELRGRLRGRKEKKEGVIL